MTTTDQILQVGTDYDSKNILSALRDRAIHRRTPNTEDLETLQQLGLVGIEPRFRRAHVAEILEHRNNRSTTASASSISSSTAKPFLRRFAFLEMAQPNGLSIFGPPDHTLRTDSATKTTSSQFFTVRGPAPLNP